LPLVFFFSLIDEFSKGENRMSKVVIRNLVVMGLVFLGGAQGAMAKEMAQRLGVGFRNAYSFDLPSVAVVYHSNEDFSFVGAIGVDTQEDNSKSAFTAGLRRIVFKEINMNFYMGGNLSMLSVEKNAETESGFEISALAGGEFFLQGLDNLAFTFEAGVAIENVDGSRFRTIGDSINRAGIIFYF
jgi:hypothetical protein